MANNDVVKPSLILQDNDDAATASGYDSLTKGSDEVTPTELFPKSMHEKNFESDLELDYAYIGDKEAFEAEVKECFANSGIVGLRTRLAEKLEEWKNVPLRIGVTGRSGVGKSTFINTIRGMPAESEYAAATDVIETTSDVEEYPHPQNKQLVFCDLPGVGTDNFPKSTYLTDERIGFDKFDMFIILTSSRIFEDDIWLAKAVKERGKSYLLIRTQIDIEIDKVKKAKPNTFKANPNAAKNVEDRLRSNLETSLVKDDVFEEDRVFLIDCTDLTWRRFDFERLMTRVLTDFPALQREAFMMALTAKTTGLIKEKVNALRSRAFMVSFVSALVGAMPTPRLSFSFDANLIASEAFKYREQLGLTDKQLIEVAKESGVDIDVLKKTVNLQTRHITWTEVGIAATFSPLLATQGVESTAIILLPIIGSVIAGSISFASTRYILHKILDMLESDALALEKYLRIRVTAV